MLDPTGVSSDGGVKWSANRVSKQPTRAESNLKMVEFQTDEIGEMDMRVLTISDVPAAHGVL